MPRFNDRTGQRFGMLVALEHVGPRMWRCRCDCGNETVVKGSNLMKTVSCGCYRAKRKGMSTTRVFRAWYGMFERCAGKKPKWQNYVDKGIKVCERWQEFENFYADMGDPPEGYSLDRIDNAGDYCPENCRWADTFTQARNTDANRRITINGETKCMAEWLESSPVDRGTVYRRLKRGWDIETALFAEAMPHHERLAIREALRVSRKD